MTFKERQTKGSICLLTSIILALIGFIIFIVSSTTGYLAGNQINLGVLITSIIALVFGTLLFIFKDSTEKYDTLISIVIGLLLSVSVCLFIFSRKHLAADVWFIPVNYPEAEETALWVSIVGVGFYILSIIALALSSIFGIEADLSKKVKTIIE